MRKDVKKEKAGRRSASHVELYHRIVMGKIHLRGVETREREEWVLIVDMLRSSLEISRS